MIAIGISAALFGMDDSTFMAGRCCAFLFELRDMFWIRADELTAAIM